MYFSCVWKWGRYSWQDRKTAAQTWAWQLTSLVHKSSPFWLIPSLPFCVDLFSFDSKRPRTCMKMKQLTQFDDCSLVTAETWVIFMTSFWISCNTWFSVMISQWYLKVKSPWWSWVWSNTFTWNGPGSKGIQSVMQNSSPAYFDCFRLIPSNMQLICLERKPLGSFTWIVLEFRNMETRITFCPFHSDDMSLFW